VGKVIFDFGIVDAIERGILCEFNYIPLHFRLSDEDKKAIKKVYRRYAARIKNGILENEAKRYLYIEIAKVRKLSKNKIPVFVNFLMSNQNILVNCIIFVEDMKYGKFVQDIIVNYNQNYHTYYSNDEKKNLSKFASGEFSILITCKRISQGIDIRSIKNVILFSASRAKLETIQRIGRCLRIDPENPSKVANVVDFITTNEKGADSDDDEDYENTDEARERWLINTSKTRRLKHEG
jgi:superfamily II DNA or RNA helicase